MFTFNQVRREALDPARSLAMRWSHARRCVYKHARLTNHDFYGTVARFCQILDLDLVWVLAGDANGSNTAAQLGVFIDTIAAERDRFRAKYTAYRQHRLTEKRRGRLQSVATYQRMLHAPDYYDQRCMRLAPGHEGGSYGYINATTEFVISPRYEWAGAFAFGYAQVRVDGQLSTPAFF